MTTDWLIRGPFEYIKLFMEWPLENRKYWIKFYMDQTGKDNRLHQTESLVDIYIYILFFSTNELIHDLISCFSAYWKVRKFIFLKGWW